MTKNKNNLSLGEKLEVIIRTRKSGWLGQYLGDSPNIFCGACIDGVNYHVLHNVEVNIDWYWHVKNINTGSEVKLKDQYDLCCLVSV